MAVHVQAAIGEDGWLDAYQAAKPSNTTLVGLAVLKDLQALGDTVEMAKKMAVSQAGVNELDTWLEVRTPQNLVCSKSITRCGSCSWPPCGNSI